MVCDVVSPVVERLLSSLTLQEKASLLAGQNMWQTAQIDRLGIKPLQTTDGPAGARGTKWNYGSLTTLIPCGVSLAATFDLELVEQVGGVLGEETRCKGCHVLLAPTMNLSRSPLGGRNFEGYGEDPFLIGAISTSIIRGIQSQGVGACMKHFILNDTETRRFNVDQAIDGRTLREVYMKPFTMALQASPWTSMVSYPKVNGVHADMSLFVLQNLLRDELQFDRLVMSDWGGCNSTVQSLIAGTDLEMPGPPVRRGKKLVDAVLAGKIDEKGHLDSSVRRVLQLLEKARLLPSLEDLNSQSTLAPSKTENPQNQRESQPLANPAFQKIIQRAAQSGLVLLKNEGLLPLTPALLKKVAILGPNARKPTAGGSGSAAVNPFYITTPEHCLAKAMQKSNPDIEISYHNGIPFSLRPPLLDGSLKLPDGSKQGIQLEFFEGHEFQGPVIDTTVWPNSLIYMMSDGDVPPSLKHNPYSYRAQGVVNVAQSGRYKFSIANTGKAKLFLDDEIVIDNTDWTRMTAGFLGCSSEDRCATLNLEAGRAYRLRVDNVTTLPAMKSFDNTLFPAISGLRIGMAFEEDEDEVLRVAVQSAKESDLAILIVGHNKDSEGEGGDRPDMDLPGRTNELVSSVLTANPNTIVVVQSASAFTMPWVEQARALVLGWYQGQENGHALANALLGVCNFSGKTPITFPKTLSDHGSNAWFPAEAANDHAVFGEGVLTGYRWFDEKKVEPLWPFGFGLSYTSFSISDIHLSGKFEVSSTSDVAIYAKVSNSGQCDGHEVLQVYASPSTSIREAGLQSYLKTLVGFTKVWVPAGESKNAKIVIRKEEFQWYDEEAASWRLDPGTYKLFVGTDVKSVLCQLDVEIV